MILIKSEIFAELNFFSLKGATRQNFIQNKDCLWHKFRNISPPDKSLKEGWGSVELPVIKE